MRIQIKDGTGEKQDRMGNQREVGGNYQWRSDLKEYKPDSGHFGNE
jgi:hypothetical protein